MNSLAHKYIHAPPTYSTMSKKKKYVQATDSETSEGREKKNKMNDMAIQKNTQHKKRNKVKVMKINAPLFL